jgi:pyruvate,water dikinase
VSGAVLDAYDRFGLAGGPPAVAVRSSGAEEDSVTASFAGQFASVLGVQGHAALLDALKECWASYLSPRSLAYRAQHGIGLGVQPRFGVIVQAQVFAARAGVVFTVHPLEPEGDAACIEANRGTGDSVVGGLATPDTLTVSRSSGNVVDEHIGSQRHAPVLTDVEAREVLELGLRIEEVLGGPQDIEWAYDGKRLWILQARPITALSPRGV